MSCCHCKCQCQNINFDFENPLNFSQLCNVRKDDLDRVKSIKLNENELNTTEKQDRFIELSRSLINVHTLDLSNQNINDKFIESISYSGNLFRLSNLYLSNNPKITIQSINELLDSDKVGSVRYVPEMSRHGLPMSYIFIQIDNTGITEYEDEYRRWDFSIKYTNVDRGKIADPAIKVIYCEGKNKRDSDD